MTKSVTVFVGVVSLYKRCTVILRSVVRLRAATAAFVCNVTTVNVVPAANRITPETLMFGRSVDVYALRSLVMITPPDVEIDT
jgi:hypothetical protein